jgi:hypothetical protein
MLLIVSFCRKLPLRRKIKWLLQHLKAAYIHLTKDIAKGRAIKSKIPQRVVIPLSQHLERHANP